VSPPGGRLQPDSGPGGRLAPGPVHVKAEEVMWNERPVGLSKLGMIAQPLTSMLICVGLLGCPRALRP